MASLAQQFNDAAGLPDDARPLIEGDVIRQVGDVRIHCIHGVDYISAGTVLSLSPFKSDPALSPALMEWLRNRGKYVGKLCQYEAEGTLHEYDYDPRLEPFVCAWRKYRRDWEFNPDPARTEALCIDEATKTFGYCDFGGDDNRGCDAGDCSGSVTIDVKTAQDCWISHRLQLCGYTKGRRVVVQLLKTGEYIATECEEISDYDLYAQLAWQAHMALREREEMAAKRKLREQADRRAYRARKAAA